MQRLVSKLDYSALISSAGTQTAREVGGEASAECEAKL